MSEVIPPDGSEGSLLDGELPKENPSKFTAQPHTGILTDSQTVASASAGGSPTPPLPTASSFNDGWQPPQYPHDPPTPPPPKTPPNGPVLTPISPTHSLLGGQSTGPQVCCAGFDPETSCLEAIINVPQPSNFGLKFCEDGELLRVGFWVTILGNDHYAGEASVHVFDLAVTTNPVFYCVKLQLPPELVKLIQDCSKGPQIGSLTTLLKATAPNVNTSYTLLQDFGREAKANTLIGHGATEKNLIKPTEKPSPISSGTSQNTWQIQFPKRSSFGSITIINRRFPTELIRDSQVFPVHASALKNGKVLLFSGSGNERFWHQDPSRVKQDSQYAGAFIPAIDTAALFDPETSTIVSISPPAYDTFCAGHTLLEDGKLLVVGGTDSWDNLDVSPDHHGHWFGSKHSAVFDPDLNTWTSLPSLSYGRWYPTSLMLLDGSIIVVGGHTSNDDVVKTGSGQFSENDLTKVERHENTDIDTFNFGNFLKNDWKNFAPWQNELDDFCTSDSPGNITHPGGAYMRLHTLHDGTVFSASLILEVFQASTYPKNPPLYNGHWQDVSSNPQTRIWRPQTRTWLGITGNDGFGHDQKGQITSQPVLSTGSDTTSVLLPLLPSKQYAEKILLMAEKSPEAYICEPFGENTQWMASGKPDTTQRAFGAGVILANGTVALMGGYNPSDPSSPFTNDDDSHGVHVIEIYDSIASTPGWKKTNDQLVIPRGYHSNYILMRDARVMICGGQIDNHAEWEQMGPNPFYPTDRSGRNLGIEIYTPDYLWRGPRPIFSSTPEMVAMGSNITVRLKDGWTWDLIDLERILLVKLYSATHSQNIDQRCVGLELIKKNDIEGTLLIPALVSVHNSNMAGDRGYVLTPGYYYLFINSTAGAPSLGHIIRIELPIPTSIGISSGPSGK